MLASNLELVRHILTETSFILQHVEGKSKEEVIHIFEVLKDKAKFEKVYTTGYSIAWSKELEMDALSIYLDITGKHFGDISHSKFTYAAD